LYRLWGGRRDGLTANLWTTQDLEPVGESCFFPASALSRLMIKRPFLAAHARHRLSLA